MEIRIQVDNEFVILKPVGNLVASTADDLKGQIGKLFAKKYCNFIVDLGQVEFMDSSGLGACIGIHREALAKGGKLVLCCLQENIQRLFSITKADQKLTLRRTLPDASQALMEHLIQSR